MSPVMACLQRTQLGESDRFNLKSRLRVGKMLCINLKRKLVSFPLNPLVFSRDHVLGQFTSGFDFSGFINLAVCFPVTDSIVTFFSRRTRYHCAEDIFNTFRVPPNITSLMVEKKEFE